MTWYFDPSGTTMNVYDPSGTQFETGLAFSGSWSDVAPDEFYTAAAQHVQNAPDMDTGLAWGGELIANDIEEGTPP